MVSKNIESFSEGSEQVPYWTRRWNEASFGQKMKARVEFWKDNGKDPAALLSYWLLNEIPDLEPYLDEPRKYPHIQFPIHQWGNFSVIERFRGTMPVEEGRKLGILALGGGQAGVISAGVCVGMYSTGAFDRADVLVGVSAGLAAVSYVETGQGEVGASIYWEDNIEGRFVKLPRNTLQRAAYLWNAYRSGTNNPIIDTKFVGRCFREWKPIDVEMLKASEKEIYAVLMDCETGQSEFVNMKAAEDSITVMEAAICVPGISTIPWVEIGSKRFADPAFTNPIPLKEMFDDLGCTDVLIVANAELGLEKGFLESMSPLVRSQIAKNKTFAYNPRLIDVIRNSDAQQKEAYEYVLRVLGEGNPQRQVAVVSPKRGITKGMVINNLEDDPNILRRAFEAAKYLPLVSSPEIVFIEYYRREGLQVS